MAIRRFRTGQWLRFSGNIPGVHKTKAGKMVGIYHPARLDPWGRAVPELVYVVNPLGENIDTKDGPLAFPPEQLLDLEPITSRDEIPAARLATANPNWRP